MRRPSDPRADLKPSYWSPRAAGLLVDVREQAPAPRDRASRDAHDPGRQVRRHRRRVGAGPEAPARGASYHRRASRPRACDASAARGDATGGVSASVRRARRRSALLQWWRAAGVVVGDAAASGAARVPAPGPQRSARRQRAATGRPTRTASREQRCRRAGTLPPHARRRRLYTYPRAHLTALPFRVERRLEDARPSGFSRRRRRSPRRSRKVPLCFDGVDAAVQHYRTGGGLCLVQRFES